MLQLLLRHGFDGGFEGAKCRMCGICCKSGESSNSEGLLVVRDWPLAQYQNTNGGYVVAVATKNRYLAEKWRLCRRRRMLKHPPE
jgi:hypothetical protein